MNGFKFRESLGWVLLAARESAGWVLILLGLACFYWAYTLVENRSILYVWVPTVIGIFVFRGGIHLLKVAVAARVCQQTQDQLYPPAAPGVATQPGRQGRST